MSASIRSWAWPLGLALLCLVAGGLSGAVSGGGGEWYRSLAKPPGTPPSWVFGPVWSVLYLLMGWAGGLLMVKKAWFAVRWFAAQFALNLAWSPVFFGLQQPAVALVVIVAMGLLIGLTVRAARPVSPAAARLLLPYWAWVTYATWLNAGFAFLNR
jgi:tryptophan-rich sensory protein